VVVAGDQRKAVRDRPQSGGLGRQVDLIGKVGAADDLRERAERRIAGTVLLNQGLERATPYGVDVGIGGPRRIEARRRLAALGLRQARRRRRRLRGR